MGIDGQRHAIPPTLLISSIGVMKDVAEAVTMDLKEAGNSLYLVGKFAPTFGGSHFSMITSQSINDPVPSVDEITPQVYKTLHQAIKAKLIRSCHDLSEGGLAIAAAEMCIGGRLGVNLTLESSARILFGETTGCLLVEVNPVNVSVFESNFKALPFTKIGQVTSDPVLKFSDNPILVSDLVIAFNPPA